MFWLRIQPNDIDRNGEKHQYIISSGGQVSSSRGFAFLYAKEESKFKLQLQTTTGVYRTALTNIPENWFHFAFTFKEGKHELHALLVIPVTLLMIYCRTQRMLNV